MSNIKDEILKEISKGKTVSGGALASRLGVSRNAVWKEVNALRREGYFISGLTGGYVLGAQNTRLCAEQLCATVSKKIIFKDKTGSTNEDLKAIAEKGADEFTVLVARSQSGGKGRLGRSFYSYEGGLYFSVLLRPEASAETCLRITTAAASAMAEAIGRVSHLQAKIKWVNDIYIKNKKVCGILTEGVFDAENGVIKYAVLGVGVNVGAPRQGFPDDISDKAGALFDTPTPPSLAYCALLKEFLSIFSGYYKNIDGMTYIKDYRSRSLLDGKTVTYEKDGKKHTAQVLGIGDNAELIVSENGKKRFLVCGEVTISEYE